MCPACIANAALIVTGVFSTGGWTAFALRRPRRRAVPGNHPESRLRQKKTIMTRRVPMRPPV
jgi:hypothetical protein